MPNIKSAKKRVKTDAKKKVANKNNASSMRTAIKKVKAEIKNENKELATAYANDPGNYKNRQNTKEQTTIRGT